jgi:hypothetical protein
MISEQRLAGVIAINNDIASLIDRKTGQSFDALLSAPGGIMPMVGDQWSMIRISGQWGFQRLVVPRDVPPQQSFLETMKVLIELGLVDPSYVDGSGEAMHLAYIGEMRWFAFTPNDRWVAPGASVDRVQYRDLANRIDPFIDGTDDPATYWASPLVVPSAPSFGFGNTVRPYVCARN